MSRSIHYFGTYPSATNANGTPFTASSNTPRVNNLSAPLDVNNNFKPLNPNPNLLGNNPNKNNSANNTVAGGMGAVNPFRLSPSQAITKDQDHGYTDEQLASDGGKMDLFPLHVGRKGPPPAGSGAVTTNGLVMGYYDGNTVTALWNYAQNYALNDNHYTSVYGPSTPGALDLISGQTNGLDLNHSGPLTFSVVADGNGNYSVISDGDPTGDVCSSPTNDHIQMAGRNIGDLLNNAGITWGWFEGGFDLTITNPDKSKGCNRSSTTTAPGQSPTPQSTSKDYVPHHQPFQYYASTANPTHARPSSTLAIGHSFIPGTTTAEPANHQYDINDFFSTLMAGNLPAVAFLKAAAFQDGHPGNSDPLDEQDFIVNVINALQESPFWPDTAVIILYDDSDGWYDHQMAPVVNPSFSTADALNGTSKCNSSGNPGFQQGIKVPTNPLNGNSGQPAQGRCGYGTRVPLLAISPWAKSNYVDHTLVDQSSVTRFIEDNWLSGQRVQRGGPFDSIAGTLNNMFNFEDQQGDPSGRKAILDPTTGEVVNVP
jgi:phospholipase C